MKIEIKKNCLYFGTDHHGGPADCVHVYSRDVKKIRKIDNPGYPSMFELDHRNGTTIIFRDLQVIDSSLKVTDPFGGDQLDYMEHRLSP